MASYRKQRIENDIIRLINRTIINEIYDPVVKLGHVSHVKLSADFFHAVVYLDCYDRSQIQTVVNAFKKAQGVFSQMLAQNLYLAKSVKLHFVKDDAIDNVLKIEQIINSLKN
ncbi:30S ribosome-binding factor RbfA [Mycoplasmoides genitalium]